MRRSWLILLAAALCWAWAAQGAPVFGQEPTPGAGGAGVAPAPEAVGEAAAAPPTGEAAPPAPATTAEAPKADSLVTIIMKNSGWPGWTIIVMSVVAVYLIIRFAYYLRRKRFIPESLVVALEDDLDNRRVAEAIEKCRQSDCVLARTVESGLSEIRAGYDEMVALMEETGNVESIRLHQQVGWLAIIGAIAPMLGLLGTVLGMTFAFAVIGASDTQPSPRALANYIQLALITTVEGLTVAVPVLLAYAIFKNKVITLMLEVGVAATDLIDRFKGVPITPAMMAGVREAVEKGRPKAVPVPPPPPPAPKPETPGPPPPPPPPPPA